MLTTIVTLELHSKKVVTHVHRAIISTKTCIKALTKLLPSSKQDEFVEIMPVFLTHLHPAPVNNSYFARMPPTCSHVILTLTILLVTPAIIPYLGI